MSRRRTTRETLDVVFVIQARSHDCGRGCVAGTTQRSMSIRRTLVGSEDVGGFGLSLEIRAHRLDTRSEP